MSTFEAEVREGRRFEFGKNWLRFLSTVTEERIGIAEASLKEMLRVDDLEGRTVVDVGSGSGLFSLAARRLGARVHSFDYDPASVACTHELRSRYFPDDADWKVEQGSVLDTSFLGRLGTFDIVYSWGVLHHTGNMWAALDNAASLVGENGRLFIAIYNDEGRKSRIWTRVKRTYCSGAVGRAAVTAFFIPYFALRALWSCVVTRENVFAGYKKRRGMSITHDWFDWLGGFPFEVATVDAIFHFYRNRGFALDNLKSNEGWGNNQFVFARPRAAQTVPDAPARSEGVVERM